MREEAVRLLAPTSGAVALDATAGAGGHSEALLDAARVRLFALDADPVAVAAVSRRLMPYGARATVIEANFADCESVLAARGVERIDCALFDLGWRREQLSLGKGFSFEGDEPLNMSFADAPHSGFTAADILNRWSEQAIADALFGYGGERYARRIARAVAQRREKKPFATTAELVDVVRASVPAAYRRGKTHAATKTFQALRIAVNDEMRALEAGIRGAWRMLARGGRLAVISFHSFEDRAVKELFRALAREGGVILTKKPVLAGLAERRRNPSARSAKLRVIEKPSADL